MIDRSAAIEAADVILDFTTASAVVGDHSVVFAAAESRNALAFSAGSGDVRAGSLTAARWIIGRAPGEYGMQDVLGLAQDASANS